MVNFSSLFITFDMINLFLAFIFIYYAFRNAFRIRGAMSQYLMAAGGFFFVIAGVISGLEVFISSSFYSLKYTIFLIGFILVSVGEIYSNILIRKIINKKPWKTLLHNLSHSSYRVMGILIIVLSTIPIWTLDIVAGSKTDYGVTAFLFKTIGFLLLVIGERKLYVKTNVPSERVAASDDAEISLLREDIAAVTLYTDILNIFLSSAEPSMTSMIVDETLKKWREEHPVLFEKSINNNGKIDGSAIIKNLDRLYEKNRLSMVLKEFSSLANRLVYVYSNFTSSKYAKIKLAQSYQVVKSQHNDSSIILDILKAMPEGIMEEEKLAVLNREELEKKVRERTEEILKANKELQREINERKKTEEQLRGSKRRIELQNIRLKNLDELKSNFLNITSHELRTPMAAIKGYIQMLIKQTLGKINEEQKKSLEIVLRNTDRLDGLIQDILDISQLESGSMKFVPEETDVRRLMIETLDTMQRSAETKNIEINADIDVHIPKLVVDHKRIQQVLMNLVDNAIKFSPEGSSVMVRAKKQEVDKVLFEIQDQGRGVPEEHRDKIFDTFYQVDSGMDRKFGGVGLGLSLSRGIVMAHGGHIWVDSNKGRGSSFRFTLPVKPVGDIERRFREIDIFGMEDRVSS